MKFFLRPLRLLCVLCDANVVVNSTVKNAKATNKI